MDTLSILSILHICGDDVIAICITVVLVVSIVSFAFCKWQINKYKGLADRLIGLNSFRGAKHNCNYSEAFMLFSVSDFLDIPMI